jgi:two-component system nitrogen regulation sensor histidine kinase NtrY
VQPAPADLNEIVDAAMTVFAGRLQNISVTLDLDREIPTVLADKEQIRRVIVNLVDNAAEAMNNAPVRKLRIATVQQSPETVELSITDTGSGVSADDKEKLFLPYFSTKSRGTGLGLAIVSRIIAEHHGRVRVEDNAPRGTRFLVELNTAPVDVAVNDLPATLKA